MMILRDLIDVRLIQSMLNSLNEINYFPSAIIDNEGNILTATAWQDICKKFHRVHPQSEGECINCDFLNADQLPGTNTTVIYRCPHGIINCATPIIIDRKHLGSLFTGQIFLDKPDIEYFKQQANSYGFDEVAYLRAVENLPVWTQKQLDKHIADIRILTEILVTIGYNDLKEKEARRTIQENEGRLRILFDASPDVILLVDIETDMIADANLAALKLFRKPLAEIIGMHYSNLHAIKKKASTKETPPQYSEISPIETLVLLDDESEVAVEILSNTIMINGKGYIQKVFRDITERKRLETELLAAKEKAEESDRLKTAFLTNMSHEFRTPMNGILGFADLLRDDTLTTEERHEYISIINDSGQSLLNVLTNVIDISKIDSRQINCKIASFNLNEMLDELYRWFRKEIKLKDKSNLKVEVIKELRDENSVIFSDYAKVRHIFNLLLNNSVKFTHFGFIRFGYAVKEKHLRFFVQDSGKGIAQEKQHFIFDRFRQEEETMSRKNGGVGLGLAIAKSLVEMLDGSIWVESEFGKGATFFFEVPS